MNNKILLLTFTLLLSQSTHASFMHKAYCTVFGNKDASPTYQTTIHSTLKDYDIPNAETVPVKQMNKVGPYILGHGVYSFTAQGVWLNEKLLEHAASEKDFLPYHEAHHYVLGHHTQLLQRLALGAGIVAGAVGCSDSIVQKVTTKNTARLLVAGISGILTAKTYLSHIIKPLSANQECAADAAATRYLVKKGKYTVVTNYMHYLKEILDSYPATKAGPWHATLAQQYDNIHAHYTRAQREQNQSAT